jgi:hypothetical protein
MTDVIEREPEAAPAELPADVATPAPADDLDQLLQEYEEKTRQAEPEPTRGIENPASPDAPVEDVDDFLAGLNKDSQRATQLQGELDTLGGEVFRQQELAALDKFCGELQNQLGPNLPDDYAKTSLLAMAAQDPNLEVAWKYRGLTNEQLAAADRQFRELEALHFKVMQTPDTDPRRQQAINWIEQRGRELGIAMNARAIIANARRSVLKRAESFKPIDIEATQLRDDIAFQMKQGQGPAVIPEAPVRWGSLSAREGREKVLKEFGFDPGWGH